MMKYIFALVFLIFNASSLLSQSVLANEEPMLVYLKGYRDLVGTSYPLYVRKTFENTINMHYWVQLENYSKVSQYLNEYLGDLSLEFFEVKERWQQSIGRLQSTSGYFEESAIELKHLLSRINRISTRAETITQDFDALKTSWDNRCNGHQVAYLMRRFDPINTLSVENISLNPTAADYKIQVGISASLDGGNIKPFAESTGISDYAVVGGLVIGTILGGEKNGPLYASIGMSIGAMISGVIDAKRRSDAINQQWDVMKDIYDLQLNILRTQSQAMEPYIRQQCSVVLPDSSLSGDSQVRASSFFQAQVEDSSHFLEQTTETHLLMRKEYQDLEIRYFHEAAALKERYFLQLEEDYLRRVDENFEDQVKIDGLARKYFTTKVVPVYFKIKKSSKDLPGFVRWRQLYQFWDALLLGDTQFYQSASFYIFNFDLPSTDFNSSFWVDQMEVIRPWFF